MNPWWNLWIVGLITEGASETVRRMKDVRRPTIINTEIEGVADWENMKDSESRGLTYQEAVGLRGLAALSPVFGSLKSC